MVNKGMMAFYTKKIQDALNLMMKKYNPITKSSSSDQADNGEVDEEDFMSCKSSGSDSKDSKKAVSIAQSTQKVNSDVSTSQNQNKIINPDPKPAIQKEEPKIIEQQKVPNTPQNQLPFVPPPIGASPNQFIAPPFSQNNFGIENLPPEIRKHLMQPTEFNDQQSIDFMRMRSESDDWLNTSNNFQVKFNQVTPKTSEGVGIQAQPSVSDGFNVQVNAESKPLSLAKQEPKQCKSIEIQVSPPRDSCHTHNHVHTHTHNHGHIHKQEELKETVITKKKKPSNKDKQNAEKAKNQAESNTKGDAN